MTMDPIDVDGVSLTFQLGWQALKIDEAPWYRDGDAIGTQVKAVDVTAFGPAGHWWIEVKDCHGHEPANQPRLSPGDPKPAELVDTEVWIADKGWDHLVEAKRRKLFVVDEVVQKVAGTLATLAAADRAPVTEMRAAEVRPYAQAYMPGEPLTVVLLLTWSLPDFSRLASRLTAAMEQRLRAFNVTCLVVNEAVTAPAQPWRARRTAI
jgi:hypothetical protein